MPFALPVLALLLACAGCVGLRFAPVAITGKVEGAGETLAGFAHHENNYWQIGLISTSGAQCRGTLVRKKMPGNRAFHRPFPPSIEGASEGTISCDDGRYGKLRFAESSRAIDQSRIILVGELAGRPLRLEQPTNPR